MQGKHRTNVSNTSDRPLRGHFLGQAACQAHSMHCLTSHNNPGKRVFLFVPILQMKVLSLGWAKWSARKRWLWVSSRSVCSASRFSASPAQQSASCSPELTGEGSKPGSFRAEPNEISRGNTWYWEASSSVPFSLDHILHTIL